MPAGGAVPRLEGRVTAVRARGGQLARYREVCGFADDGCLPITYPHVLAMPLQFAILTHPRFPVRLMGLVHLANEIEQARALPADRAIGLRAWIEGHREVERGHEFELFTAVEDEAGTAWSEKSTLLARRAATGKPASRGARQALRYEKPDPGASLATASVEVPRSIGRRYGWLSGDLNPIHLADAGAKLFGFERAVAHGMWSLAYSLAQAPVPVLGDGAALDTEFLTPVQLPGKVAVKQWTSEGRMHRALCDVRTGRVHMYAHWQPV